MKEKNILATFGSIIFYIIIIVLFLVNIAQLNNMEKRLIEVNNRLEKIEQNEPSGGISLPPSGQNSSTAVTPTRKYLHPEVENLLKEDGFKMRLPETKPGGIFTRWYGTDPKGFNMITQNDGELTRFVEIYVADYLALRSRLDPDKYRPQLAERIEITDDYKEYTIYLKKGVKWHRPSVDWSNPRYNWLKGDHFFTAKDVKFTIDVILNDQVECPHLRNYYKDVESVKIIDDYALVVRWKKKTYNSIDFTAQFLPIPEFLYGYDEDGKPFPKETFGLNFNKHWYNQKAIGCGPYEFASYVTGSEIKLKRFNDYYGEKPPIETIQYLLYPDQKQNLLKVKAKEQDFGILYATDYREVILNGKPDSPFKNGNIVNGTFDEMCFHYIGWNNESPLFSDKRVRKAMTHAFNGANLLKDVFLNLGEITTGPLYVKSPGYDKSLEPFPFDIKKAGVYLAEAGWKDVDGDGILEKKIGADMKRFEFDLLLYGNSPEWAAVGNVFKEDLLKIGIKMNVRPVEWSVMQKKMEDKDFDAYTGAWGMPWEQDPYQIWHSSQASIPKSSNMISFRNKEADKLIEDLRETFDKEKRNVLYRKFHRLIYEEQPYTFFYCRKRPAVWWNHLHRVIFNFVKPQDDSKPWSTERR